MSHGSCGLNPEEALKKLIEGNQRFAGGKSEHPNQSGDRRVQIAKEGQAPFAVVAYCSDSRSPVEQIFDAGNGDIFGIRLAGHVLSEEALGSIQYAVEHLGTKLVVILGHTKCGAVTATVQGGDAHGPVKSLVERILPAVERAKKKGGSDLVQDSINEHVEGSVELLKSQDFLKSPEKCVHIVGMIYDIETGKVSTDGLTSVKIEGKSKGEKKHCCCQH